MRAQTHSINRFDNSGTVARPGPVAPTGTDVEIEATRATNLSGPPHNPGLLAFIGDKQNGSAIDFWKVSPTGDYGLDCELGSRLAETLAQHLEQGGCVSMLGWVLKSMIEHGRCTGIEVGFARYIAQQLAGVPRAA